MNPTATVVTFEHDGTTYEVDHLGLAVDEDHGKFAIYYDGKQIADFSTAAAQPLTGDRPELPDNETLKTMAKQALAKTAQDGSR